MRLSADEVRRVAELARLELAEGEAEALAAQLGDILRRIDRLDDTASATPEGHARGPAAAAQGGQADDGGSRLRSDEPSADPLATEPSAFAPEWVDGFFTVPRLPSHGGGAAGEEGP